MTFPGSRLAKASGLLSPQLPPEDGGASPALPLSISMRGLEEDSLVLAAWSAELEEEWTGAAGEMGAK